MEFYIEQDEYNSLLAESAGIKLVVHDHGDMSFPEDKGILLAPNTLTAHNAEGKCS